MTAKPILIFVFCLIIRHHGLLGCDVEVKVRRGTVYRASLHQHMEVKCPVQHCGRTVQVVWCKQQDIKGCKNLSNSDHIQINENKLSDEKLESVLTFKSISTGDSGLYKCKELYHTVVGHLINVTISETNEEDENHQNNTGQSENSPKDLNFPNEDKMKMISLAYFSIFLIVVLLLLTTTAIVMLGMYVRKPMPRHQPKTQEEQPSHMIPGLPKRSSPVLRQSLPMVYDISSSSTNQAQRSPVYSQIDRTKSQKSFQHHTSGEGTSQMNAISVVSSELL